MANLGEITLDQLLSATPRPTSDAPKDSRGLYGLIDHDGILRYIGSTSSANETLYKRIHQRHRTGSESTSHYFSRMYNTGRMWRDREDSQTATDGSIAKELRNAFVADHCRAVWVSLADHVDIAGIERTVLSLAPPEVIAWNRRAMAIYIEPTDLVDQTIRKLGWGARELGAIERQRVRHLNYIENSTVVDLPRRRKSKSFPKGEFRFFAIDVETANNDRSNICQIGVACVRPDNRIETWMSYVDPKTRNWACSGIHGITAHTVAGAPEFPEVYQLLVDALAGKPVYQHSGFDRSAIGAACTRYDLSPPEWAWRDSVLVARDAWPELKGNGGHGLASLKLHLDLKFTHHDAEEDAKASAQIVLIADELTSRADKIDVSIETLLEDVPPSETSIAPTIFQHHHSAQTSQSQNRSNPSMANRPIPFNPITNEILSWISSRPEIRPHFSQRDHNGTKYISAFETGGMAFAIDKMSAGKQPIWVLDRADIRAHLDAEKVAYDVYTPEKGRNSNLFKIPNFKTGQLLRIYPETLEQGKSVIAKLAR